MMKRMRRKQERPGEILEAAFEEFTAHGFAATRLEDVANRAGVTKGTIYFYFETKERLFGEMVEHFSALLLAEVDDFLALPSQSHKERLSNFIRFIYRRFALDRKGREILRFMVADGKHFPVLVARHYADFVGPTLQRVNELVQKGIAAGEFRDTPAAQFGEIIMGPAVLLGIWFLVFTGQREIDVEAFVSGHIDLMLDGLASRLP
jgi:AcrR family transcriptional regulator